MLTTSERTQIGVSLLVILSLLVLINFRAILGANFQKIARGLYIRRLKKRRDAVLGDRNLALTVLQTASTLNESLNFASPEKKARIKVVLDNEVVKVESQMALDLKKIIKGPKMIENEEFERQKI